MKNTNDVNKKLPLTNILITFKGAIWTCLFLQFLTNNGKFNKKEKDNDGKINNLCMGTYHR